MAWEKKNGNGTAGNGKSAYQSWLDLGNTGTEQQFINSLKGAKGDTGASGSGGGANAPSIHSYYEPKQEKSAESLSGDVYKGWTVQGYYAMYDGLVSTYPKYVRKETAPYLDMSGTYELRRYVFEPEDGYEKTIYIGAGIHGNEMAAKLGLARICQLVCNEWESSPHLAYLRKNVRMIINPIANPWGHANKIITNSNNSANTGTTGVNCNRNYDAYWGQKVNSNGGDHNGASPFSENETKWVRDTILNYGAENFHYGFDFHDAGDQSAFGDVWINYNTFHRTSALATRNLVWYLAKKYVTDREPFIWHDKDTTTSGVFPVWAGRTMGIPASTVEMCYTGSGSAVFDETLMTRTVDTYINAVLVNTIADHKAPLFKSNGKWFELEWWKGTAEYAFTSVDFPQSLDNILPVWDALVTKYPKYLKKSDTFVTSSNGKQIHYYSLTPKNYTKTVVLVGGRMLPATDYTNFSESLLRFTELMCLHGYKDAHLTYLKDNVRIIIVPYLEHAPNSYINQGNFNTSGVITNPTPPIAVPNMVSILDTIGTIHGFIYAQELTNANALSASTDGVFVLPSQDTNDNVDIESYVDYLKSTKGLNVAFNRSATSELGNYVFNQRGVTKVVRIDAGLDHKMYNLKRYQFDDSYEDTAVSVDKYTRFNYEVARRITYIANVIKLMSK